MVGNHVARRGVAAFVGIKVDACPYREVGPFTRALVAKLGLIDTMPLVEVCTGVRQRRGASRCRQWPTIVLCCGRVQHEMEFLVGVRFQLSVHHPFIALRGFLRQVCLFACLFVCLLVCLFVRACVRAVAGCVALAAHVHVRVRFVELPVWVSPLTRSRN